MKKLCVLCALCVFALIIGIGIFHFPFSIFHYMASWLTIWLVLSLALSTFFFAACYGTAHQPSAPPDLCGKSHTPK